MVIKTLSVFARNIVRYNIPILYEGKYTGEFELVGTLFFFPGRFLLNSRKNYRRWFILCLVPRGWHICPGSKTKITLRSMRQMVT